MKTICIYFSPRGTTQKYAVTAANFLGETTELDLVSSPLLLPLALADYDCAVLAMPVYSGCIPKECARQIQMIRASSLPCILLAVYGNRAFDDALAQLQALAEKQGFVPISAAGVIATHSIFPQVAAGRPDKDDFAFLESFLSASKKLLENKLDTAILSVPGNPVYREPNAVPVHPSASNKCTSCGACAKICPAKAINDATPQKTDNDKCISCGACIAICPAKARDYHNIIYKAAAKAFSQKCASKKDPVAFFAK